MSAPALERPPRDTFKAGFGALGRPDPVRTGSFKWVYLWGAPLRVMHWAAAFSIVLLVITGFMIGPPFFSPAADVSSDFFIGWVRFLHFGGAAVLVATGLVRLYWLVAGNKFERLPALFPVRKRDIVNLWKQVRFYLMWKVDETPHYLGHNPLQQMSYTGVYLFTLVMVVTGFALYGQADPNSVLFTVFHPLATAVGGMPRIRLIHHVLTWFYPAFLILHVYMSIRADIYEREAAITSIVSGGRFVPADHHYEDE